jgi:uncharacterized Zn-binding protein involved in type VI secretion
MGRSIARVGDWTTGHEDYPPVRIIEGSDFLTVNGIGIAMRGSRCEDHAREYHHLNNHTPIVSGCSDFISVNGIGIARKGDEVAINCEDHTHLIATGDDFVSCD